LVLKRAVLSGFRNISSADMAFARGTNLLCGVNGSGKTSVLEAIHMLGTGRSFRSRKNQSVIQYEREALTVFGQLDSGVALGVEKRRDGNGRIRINQTAAESSSQLAACLPLQVINSESFAALDGGPGVRRQLLDWTVFHVEHQFASHWKSYQIALRQRNALLRRGKIDTNLIAPWEEQLTKSGNLVDSLRRRIFELLRERFLEKISELPQAPLNGLRMDYRSGWRKDLSLVEALAESRQGDTEQGFTRVGPHRADLRFTLQGQDAHVVLSRGQQKMVVCALRAAMAEVLGTERRAIFLVDDLPSELDSANQQLLAGWISRCASQVFVTGIEAEVTARPWVALDSPWDTPAMFHVEHGVIVPRDKNI